MLYPYQVTAATTLTTSITDYGAALDASDTGTGKTYTALGAMAILGATPLIVCPKSVVTPWRKAADSLGVKVLDVLNIEKLKAGNTPYLKKVGANKWVWSLKRGSMLIYDEVQTASGYRSQNGTILGLCKAYGINVLMLSATACDSPLKMRAIGYLLGLHRWKDHYTWCLKHGCFLNRWGGMEFLSGPARLTHLRKLHAEIFPEKGYRVRIADLDAFPENAVFADAFDLDERSTEEIVKVYKEMDKEIAEEDSNQSPLTAQLRARQRTELLKVPLLIEMVEEILDEGRSAVVFVNFKETINKLHEHFVYASVIAGGQKERERDSQIERFQTNATRVCLAMIQAGGVGVSLHDLTGDYPRTSLITPAFNAVHVKQSLGRIHRAGGKSKCIQRIIFAANTVEEEACKSVRRKLDNINMLNDGDLSAGLLHPDD
jgi:hypothetical protein